MAGLTNTTSFCAQLNNTVPLSTTVYQASITAESGECQACSEGHSSCATGFTCFQKLASYDGLCVKDSTPLKLVPLACPLAKLTPTKLFSESCAALSAPAQLILGKLAGPAHGPAAGPSAGPALSPAAHL